jgi:hypothetical protein
MFCYSEISNRHRTSLTLRLVFDTAALRTTESFKAMQRAVLLARESDRKTYLERVMENEPLDSQPTEMPGEPESNSKNWLVPGLLLVPILGTLILSLLNAREAAPMWALFSSLVVGIICSIHLSRRLKKSQIVQALFAIVLIPVLSAFCLVTCVFGCALGGGKFGG